jgi:CheY-like chemotaxis protein
MKFRGKVLLVEDSPVNEEVARVMLETLGCSVTSVSNGREAIEAWNRDYYDLILMDCQMPVMDGYEAAQHIREHESSSCRLPIIAVTAHAISGEQQRCVSVGMDDYLAKPYSIKNLELLLERWLPGGLAQGSPAASPREGGWTKASGPVSLLSGSRTLEHTDLAKDIPSITPINWQMLDNIRSLQTDNGPDLVGKVVGIYLDRSPSLIDALEQAVQNGGFEDISKTAHSLKSSSANLGAMALAGLCKELEIAGKKQELGEAKRLLENIKMEYDAVRKTLSDAF